MKLKYYATLSGYASPASRAPMLAFYINYMDAKLIKSDEHHSNLKLYQQIDLLICQGVVTAHSGYHIIRFNDAEVALFNAAVRKIKAAIKANLVQLNFDVTAARWGTSFFEFVDPHGLTWVLEIASAALRA